MDPQGTDEIRQLTRVLQIIVVSLIMGVGLFTTYLVVTVPAPEDNASPAMPIMMLAFALLMIPCSVIVPRLIVVKSRTSVYEGTQPLGGEATAPRPQTAEGRLGALYLTRTIIAGAMLEGAAFANAITYMVTGQIYSVVVTAVLAALIAFQFPTVGRITSWIDHQIRMIKETQSLGRKDPG